MFINRNIGGFVADVTIEEHHIDRVTATENPVEQGADVTDHAYKRPAELTVKVGYSNSSIQSGGAPDYVQDIYQQFLLLQASCQTISVVTGKRQYTNMLILTLDTLTTEEWENSMMLVVEMREIIIVQTQTVTVGSSANMASPGVNGTTQSLGTQSLQSGSNLNQGAAPSTNNQAFTPGVAAIPGS